VAACLACFNEFLLFRSFLPFFLPSSYPFSRSVPLNLFYFSSPLVLQPEPLRMFKDFERLIDDSGKAQ
jgi:hypothetical protein